MRKVLYIFLLIITGSVHAQQPSFINASTSSDIYQIDFDKSNHVYINGMVNGRIYINGQYKDYNKSTKIIGQLDNDNNFKWVVVFEHAPRDMAIIGETLYVITMEKTSTETTDEVTLYLHSFDLNGNLLEKKPLSGIKGTRYDVFVDAKFTGGKILSWASLEEQTSTATLDGKNITNKMYSQYIFSMLDLNGKQIWQYKINGGIDGFTDLRLHVTHEDTWSTETIICSFGAKADLGITQYTSDIMFKEKIPLYYNKVFALKINKNGIPIKSAIIGENAITFEDILTDENGNIYLAGYHKGNDNFAKKQPDGRPYIGAKLLGKTFEYTDNESMLEPDENGFIAKMDSSWNLIWVNNLKGKASVRATKIVSTDIGIAITGSYSYDMTLNLKQYLAHPENAGYSDAFYATLTPNGKFEHVITFNSIKSNFVKAFKDKLNKIVLTGTTGDKNIAINETSYSTSAAQYGGFLYRPN